MSERLIDRAAWAGQGAGLWSVYEPAMSRALAAMGPMPSGQAGFLRSMPEKYRPAALVEDERYPGVGIIDLHGPLERHVSLLSMYLGGASYELAAEGVRRAVASPRVHSVLLDIDSPGGTLDGIDELVDAMAEAKGSLKIVAQGRGLMASAAYKVAALADEVLATRGTLVGSIGVKMMMYDFSAAFASAGIKAKVYKTGEHKGAGAMGTEITAEQDAEFQRLVDGFMAEFRRVVMAGRGMSAEAFEAVSDGRVWTAAEAQGLGLIDGVSTTEQTLTRLAEAGGVEQTTNPTKGARAMTQTTEQTTEAAGQPKAATIAELKAKFPNLGADFREKCIEGGLTMERAAVLAYETVSATAESAEADRSKAETELEALKGGKLPGTEAVGTRVKGRKAKAEASEDEPEAAAYDGDAVAEFDAKVRAAMAGGKVTRHEAVGRVRSSDPELHAAYVEQTNDADAASMIRDRFGR